MNIIKCNNYIFSSSKAMFKLEAQVFVRGRGVGATKSGVKPSTKLRSGRGGKEVWLGQKSEGEKGCAHKT